MVQAVSPDAERTHVIFCTRGQLEAAEVVGDGERNYRIRTASGTRKLEKNRALLRCSATHVAALLGEVEKLAGRIDLQKAWYAAAGQKLDGRELAALAGVAPSETSVAALHLAHSRQCAFFSFSSGRFKPVDKERIHAIAAARDRARENDRLSAGYCDLLDAGQMSEPVARQALLSLRGGHNRRSPAFRALERHCARSGMSIGELCVRHRIVASAEEIHLGPLLADHPPEVANEPLLQVDLAELELHSDDAFSIDAEGTKEIDDAFSVRRLADGTARVGVHIAVPALGLSAAARAQAGERMTSVYLPGRKLTMLPAQSLEDYSLRAGEVFPCVSLLMNFDPVSGTVSDDTMAVGKIRMAGNLSLAGYDGWQPGGGGVERGEQLEVLAQLARNVPAGIAKRVAEREFMVSQRNGAPYVVPRTRTAGIDKVVAAMMILYNCAATRLALVAGAPLVLRVDGRSVAARDARGNSGVSYAWASSPLRRYVDLCNQEQLLAALSGLPWPHTLPLLRALARKFERRKQKARAAQQLMERYWAVVWIGTRLGRRMDALVSRSGSSVHLLDAPLSVRIGAAAVEPGEHVRVTVTSADPYTLEVGGKLV